LDQRHFKRRLDCWRLRCRYRGAGGYDQYDLTAEVSHIIPRCVQLDSELLLQERKKLLRSSETPQRMGDYRNHNEDQRRYNKPCRHGHGCEE
jgi:hypothetical protein